MFNMLYIESLDSEK